MNRANYSKQAVCAAYGWGRAPDWPEAMALIARAADAREPGAERQLALVRQAPIESLLQPPPPERLMQGVRIAAARGFAPPGFGAWLIDRAKHRLADATVEQPHDRGTLRTAKTCFFPPKDCDLILAILQMRAAAMLGIPLACHEPPSVISYEVGQEFHPHVDFIDPDIPEFADELRTIGQRTATVVTYLNDDFDGAETVFPDLSLKFRGAPGDAIFFSNVRRDGLPDRRTCHAALPPTRGRKWVLSQWLRSRPFLYSPDALA